MSGHSFDFPGVSDKIVNELSQLEKDIFGKENLMTSLKLESDKIRRKYAYFAEIQDDLYTTMDKYKSGTISNIIRLNIGGKKVDLPRDSITKNNYLYTLLSGRWDHLLPKDKDGRIFFDYDYEWIEPIFLYFHEMTKNSDTSDIYPQQNLPFHRPGFNILMNYFKFGQIEWDPHQKEVTLNPDDLCLDDMKSNQIEVPATHSSFYESHIFTKENNIEEDYLINLLKYNISPVSETWREREKEREKEMIMSTPIEPKESGCIREIRPVFRRRASTLK